MSIINGLMFLAWVGLVSVTPDLANQPGSDINVKQTQSGHDDRVRQPFETPDQKPPPQAEVTRPAEAPVEDVIPLNEREVPQGQY